MEPHMFAAGLRMHKCISGKDLCHPCAEAWAFLQAISMFPGYTEDLPGLTSSAFAHQNTQGT